MSIPTPPTATTTGDQDQVEADEEEDKLPPAATLSDESTISTTTAANSIMPPSKKYSYGGDSRSSTVVRSPRFLTLGSCSKDPCGIICIFITYSAVFYADYVVTKWIVMSTFVSLWGTFHVVLFNIIVGLLLMAHIRAVFTDPGFVTNMYHGDMEEDDDAYLRGVSSGGRGMDSSSSYPDGLDPEPRHPPSVPPHYTLCPRCNVYRPPRAHHCRICKRCIRRMDHHCPWVNNCVGEFNQKYFIQFLFYVGLLSAYAIGLVLYTWVETSQQQDSEPPNHWHYKLGGGGHTGGGHFANDNESNKEGSGGGDVGSAPINDGSHLIKQTRILHSVILMLESLLFGLFVLAILIDQFSAIFTDETIVEQHISGKKSNNASSRGGSSQRRSSGSKKSATKLDLLREVCGSGHFALWILPCHTREMEVMEKRLNEVV